MSIYSHRLELIKELLSLDYEVGIIAPRGGEEKILEKMGVKFIDTPIDTRGTRIISDIILLFNIISILRKEKPDVVLTFYTKTNIYGGLACRITKTHYIENITGLGSAVSGGGWMQRVMVFLYSQAVKSASMVFFQNRANRQFFKEKKISVKESELLPGSGVSLDRFPVLDYPEKKESEFVFVSRIIKEKGIEEYVNAAKEIKKKHPDTLFHLVGPCDQDYLDFIKQAQTDGIIIYHGKLFDIKPLLGRSHCTVFPSYYAEGMANVLLESASSGRPLITTAMDGCKETVDDNITGFIVRERDYHDLTMKLEKFILLPYEEKKRMGLKGREKMEREFNREIVTKKYINVINKTMSK